MRRHVPLFVLALTLPRVGPLLTNGPPLNFGAKLFKTFKMLIFISLIKFVCFCPASAALAAVEAYFDERGAAFFPLSCYAPLIITATA